MASASLNGKAAMPISEVDHHTICKYDSKFRGGYRCIIASLLRLKGLLRNNVAAVALRQLTVRKPTLSHLSKDPSFAC